MLNNEILYKGYYIKVFGRGVLPAVNSQFLCRPLDTPVDTEAVIVQISILYLFYVWYIIIFHPFLVTHIITYIRIKPIPIALVLLQALLTFLI